MIQLALLAFVLLISLTTTGGVQQHLKRSGYSVSRSQYRRESVATGSVDGMDGFTDRTLTIASKTSVLKKFLKCYNEQLQSRPYITKMTTAALVGGLGDALIQLLPYFQTKSILPFSLRRLAVMMTVSCLYVAPVIHIWFNFLSRLPIPKSIDTPLGRALTMMLVDQTVGATMITIGFFVVFELVQRVFPPYSPSFNAGGDIFITAYAAGLIAIHKNLWNVLLKNWCIWPLANFINFWKIPLEYRVLFANIISVGWNMELSSTANSGH